MAGQHADDRGWELARSVPNPWGQIPLTAGGKSLTPAAQQYMQRLLDQQESNDTPSRRHHYVPRTYLRQWSPDGRRVWTLDTATGTARLLGVADVCVKENFHRVVGPDGEAHNRVELLFGVIDTELRRIQSLLLDLATPESLSFDDFLAIGITMAVQRMRTLQQRRLQQQYSEWLTAQNPRDFSILADNEAAPHRVAGFHTKLLFEAMWESAEAFTTRQLEIWDDPRGRFITSDVPVVVPFKDGARPNLLAAKHVVWPISPHRAISLSNDHVGLKAVSREVTPRVIEGLRADVIRGRERMIFATEDQLRYLPVGKPQQRRTQVRLRCSQWSPAGDYIAPPGCVFEFTEGYGVGPDIRLCQNGLHREAPGMLEHI